MIAIAQVESLLQSAGLQKLAGIPLIRRHRFPESKIVGILFVVAGADEVPGVAFLQKFCHCSTSEKWPVIQVRRDERQDASLVRFAGCRSLDDNVIRGRRRLRRGSETERAAEEMSPFHGKHSRTLRLSESRESLRIDSRNARERASVGHRFAH